MKQKHIDCLKRLFKLTGCYEDMVQYLIDEKIVTLDDVVTMSLEQDKEKELCDALFIASRREKIQLLQFDWVVLPVERLRVKLVTEMSTKEFTYNF